jgi:hypothetical protein
VGWLAGGLWLVAREAGMVRRIAYGLGIVAVAVAAALVVRYLWSGAHAGRDAGWDKARVLLLVTLLAGLPWVARRRGVFGPAGRSVAARVVRAGGCAALVALVLDFARIEHFPGPAMSGLFSPAAEAWSWAREAVALVLIAACLAAVLIVPARWPRARPVLVGWGAVAAGLVLFFTVAPVQVLITFYAAGILAVTSRRSPVSPATLAISTGTGIAGGLLMIVLWNLLQARGPSHANVDRAGMLFMLLVGLAAAATAATACLVERRGKGPDDSLARRKARMWQCLAAGPLTAATAALVLPLIRAGAAVHLAAGCPATHFGHCTAAPAVWMFFLVMGPVFGLAAGTVGGIPAPAAQPPRRPPPDPPGEPDQPQPGSTRAGGLFVKI